MRFIIFILFLIANFQAYAVDHDQVLQKVIEIYQLKKSSCDVNTALINKNLIPLGKLLFESKILSGSGDTSCATCHIDKHSLADALPMSVGVGGSGEGHERLNSNGIVVARNAFTLFGRSTADFNTFFWDGMVQEIEGKIVSPIGNGYTYGFKSPLSVAAIMPLLARDEFLGERRLLFNNQHIESIDDQYYFDRFLATNQIIRSIPLSSNSPDLGVLNHELKLIGVDTLSLPLVGNALASFITQKTLTECEPSDWDHYLAGDLRAISATQKEGATIFFGKGRCSGCHNGALYTDFGFHSLGVPQGELGPYLHRQDIGRATVTFDLDDRYRFRTPPLIRVSQTEPYGHSGAFSSLEEVVLFHINPIPFFEKYGWTSEREELTYGRILSTRSEILGFIDISSNEELSSVVEFLKAL